MTSTERTPPTKPLMPTQIIVSALLNGQWVSSTFNTADPTWRAAIKAYRECNKHFKITYK